jgi:hypothetical protein
MAPPASCSRARAAARSMDSTPHASGLQTQRRARRRTVSGASRHHHHQVEVRAYAMNRFRTTARDRRCL